MRGTWRRTKPGHWQYEVEGSVFEVRRTRPGNEWHIPVPNSYTGRPRILRTQKAAGEALDALVGAYRLPIDPAAIAPTRVIIAESATEDAVRELFGLSPRPGREA